MIRSQNLWQAIVKKEEVDFRNNFLMGFIGHNRTGKTTIALEMAKKWKESRKDCYVIAFDPQKRFTKETVEIDGVEEPLVDTEIRLDESGVWYDRVLKFRNFLLILDDYHILLDKRIAEKGLKKLLAHRDDYNIDIIYITHTPSLILNLLTDYTTHYFIFFTQALAGKFKEKIQNFHLCSAAVRTVNKYVKVFGKGKYPNFPHCIVDTEKQTVQAFNMPKYEAIEEEEIKIKKSKNVRTV